MKRNLCVEQWRLPLPEFDYGVQERPRLELPFAVAETIDVQRASLILHVSKATVLRLRKLGRLRGYQHQMSSSWHIEYTSVVTFCDDLRVRYAIPDKRPRLSRPGLRWRDDQLLPFPFSDTIGSSHVATRLNCDRVKVGFLCQEGRLLSYRLLDEDGSPWRIYAPSLEAYIQRLHDQAALHHRVKMT